jgi:hypothetical protein
MRRLGPSGAAGEQKNKERDGRTIPNGQGLPFAIQIVWLPDRSGLPGAMRHHGPGAGRGRQRGSTHNT